MTDLIYGTKIGNLTVLRYLEHRKGRAWYLCGCRCGWYTEVQGRSLLKSNPTTSCGHCRPDIRFPLEHESWLSMKARCFIKDRKDYPRYGGRGVTMCIRWFDFFNFLEDMGFRPSLEYSLDRENNNGHYEPSNCKWSTMYEQANNRNPKNSYITIKESVGT